MKRKVNLFVLAFVLSAFFSVTKAQVKPSMNYKNPVVEVGMPDPTVIKAADGYFYVYATESTRNVPIMKSKDLVQWTYCNTAFTNKTRPKFEPRGGIWAPDINYINNKYVLYYAMSVWGGEQTCGIGVATSDSPQGPFTDHGKLFRSNEIGVQNSIDPSFLQYKGKNYLVWGSFRGIYVIELTADGLSVKPKAKKKQIAGTAFEAAYVHKHGDYYYLFASIGSCCEGLKSTYHVGVGRSKKVWGPYKDKNGKSMMENGYLQVIGSNDHFVGNGHGSQIIRDDAGQDWLFYHGISKTAPEKGRILLLDQIKWDKDGWPYVEGGSPSYEFQKAPVIK
ncbi:family 43 glycosylhydrolase [Bacteroides sp. 224]|uniref:family 43 glycosylhydrolase n=1 Tax=Bacteroides sp. 224 TaxID=2302936 RepID=UPI0013D80E99|nr:family 43 glycosylhydrolase [Bacteroides sp. 224]NDV64141.1 arabinan endo-1,5-alpha-L-arabinosidase [Bacteroides sp. 224]